MTTLATALALFACASTPRPAPQLALERSLQCEPAQVELPNQAPALILRCGEAGHPLEPVENLLRDIEVLEVTRRDGKWLAWVRRSASQGEVVFSYVFDDAGKITARTCHPSIPEEGTPVAETSGRTRFVDLCASVEPPCRPPSTGAFGSYVQFDVEEGRLVRPTRTRVAATVPDLGEAPDTCAFAAEPLPVPVDARIELGASRDVIHWRPGEGRVDEAPVVAGDLLLVGRGPRQVRIQGLKLALGDGIPRAFRVSPSVNAARVWKLLKDKLEANPQVRLRWGAGRFLIGIGAVREVWRPLEDGTMRSSCRYVDPRALDAPTATDLPTGSDCRSW